MTTLQQLYNALQVLVLTPHIRAYLEENDPKALEQAKEAILRAHVMEPDLVQVQEGTE